ncbi:PREDICTED: SNF1-related protein kinase regulatory subunit gamma-like PV42b [Tarenaya hassleriana]|uniref:SNF1-related protein kinase regulatory subunit gamma-like PV42b n=1 Tax=Tarenaya hassleriana TaxID=28532 RepID=UPI00053C98CA|nr:PREDICTED: SNF1-related protein kinase regulatory subunit gamma-like PV42b [Tarenaya hassleriana]
MGKVIPSSAPGPRFYRLRLQRLMSDQPKTKMLQQIPDDHRLINLKVRDLTAHKRRLVEVRDSSTLSDTLNTMVANGVSAVPVVAPPGHWLGAGGSMIVESDKQTGSVRKHYIGMVTMLDVLAHIARAVSDNLDRKMAAHVSSIIGHCPEGLSLWSLNPNTRILDCMEMFSKGVHRALVPLESSVKNISGVELVESASAYTMLTQMDLMRFLQDKACELGDLVLSRPVSELGALKDTVYALTDQARVSDAIKCMSAEMLNAVPIVEASAGDQVDHKQLVNGKNRKVKGTFSASDLKGCHLATLQTWLPLMAVEFAEKIPMTPLFAGTRGASPRELVTCQATSTLAQVIQKVTTKRVHRVWVVDEDGRLQGLVSLTDVIGAVRAALLSHSM